MSKALSLIQVNIVILSMLLASVFLAKGAVTKEVPIKSIHQGTAINAANQTINFVDPTFAGIWNYTDKPVAELPNIRRSYTWGSSVVGSETTPKEIYAGSYRTVQYFDKARMEIGTDKVSGKPIVTSGLLVKELITGYRQFGDNIFIQETPSDVQIAGDPNIGEANSISPTYASFRKVVTINAGQNSKPPAIGSLTSIHIDKNGNTTTLANPPEKRILAAYEPTTQHNIADVFVDFGKQTCPIWNGSS